MRVYDVAKIIGWRSRELLEWLRVQGHDVGSHSTKLDDVVADSVIRHLMPVRVDNEATPEKKASVVPEVLRQEGDGAGTAEPSLISDFGLQISEYGAGTEAYRLVGKATVRVGNVRIERGAVIPKETYLSFPDRVKAFFSAET